MAKPDDVFGEPVPGEQRARYAWVPGTDVVVSWWNSTTFGPSLSSRSEAFWEM
jgi:hypothetical protein